MADSLEPKNKDSEIQPVESGFLSQFGGLKNPVLTLFGLIGSIASIIAWLETGTDSAKIVIGAFIASFVIFISFMTLSYLEYRRKQNQMPISIVPQNDYKELQKYRPTAQIKEVEKSKELVESPARNEKLDGILRDIMTSANLPNEAQDKALQMTLVEDSNLEPNIVFVRGYRDFLYGETFMAEFENRQIRGKRIRKLDNVKAKVFYYNENGELIGTSNEGQWRNENSFVDSVKFDNSETQYLKLGDITPNRYYLAINSNPHTTISIPNKIKIIVHLTGEEDWVNDYELELQYSEDHSSSIKFIRETTI